MQNIAQFISVTEYAANMGISLPTARRQLKAGKIPFIQPGGKRSVIRIPRKVLEIPSTVSLPTPPASSSPTSGISPVAITTATAATAKKTRAHWNA